MNRLHHDCSNPLMVLGNDLLKILDMSIAKRVPSFRVKVDNIRTSNSILYHSLIKIWT